MTEPRPGCSLVAHDRLGWCGHCPGLADGMSQEAMAWRLHALGRDPGPPPITLTSGTARVCTHGTSRTTSPCVRCLAEWGRSRSARH